MIPVRSTLGPTLALFALLAGVGPPGAAAAHPPSAGPCAPVAGAPAAFARVSPLQVAGGPDAATGGQVSVAFARAYPMVSESGTRALLCIDGQGYWVKRAHIALTQTPTWAVRQHGELAQRPRLNFWRGQERLESYLSTGAAGTAAPDYQELVTTPDSTAYRFPVNGTGYMERALGNKQVQVASLLVPFPMAALDEYRFLHRRNDASLVVIVDVSGSTAGFPGPWFQRFAQARSGAAAERVMLFEAGGDDRVAGPFVLTVRQLAERRWEVRPAPATAGRSPSLHAALAAARGRIAGRPDKLPVLLVAGGDLDANDGAWEAFGPKWVVQVTPEIQDRLRDSRIPGLVKFQPFSPGSAADLAGQVQSAAPAAPAAPLSESDFRTLAVIAADARMMPLVPKDPEATAELAQPPAFAEKGADWFAVPLWVVLTEDTLKLSGAPQWP